MFDITQFETIDTAFLHLKSPVDEEPIVQDGHNVGITFHAPGSEAYEAAATKRTNRSLMRAKKKIEATAEILRSDAILFLTDVTASFDHLGYKPAGDATGKDLFKALYSDRKYGWAVDQANAFLGDWSHFTKGSATS